MMTQDDSDTCLPQHWRHIDWVLTDVDDTLTYCGTLPPQTLIALAQLQQAGIKVVAVTGACAGWCDHIAQLWPVDAVIGENGAFTMEKKNGNLTLSSAVDVEEMRQKQQQLKTQVMSVLTEYSDLELTLDQAYRLCEVAIDIGQNRSRVDPEIVDQVVKKIHAFGAHATASSIHINAWYGQHSKKATSLDFLYRQGLTRQEVARHCCYVGDSLNDQAMFATLPNTVGVANIRQYWQQLTAYPSLVMTQPGGHGFCEFAQQLLQIKQTKKDGHRS